MIRTLVPEGEIETKMAMQSFDAGTQPNTPDELIAEGIRRDIAGRLEPAMYGDAVIASALDQGSLTVFVSVTIDREMTPGGHVYDLDRPEDAPFAAAIGEPAVASILERMRRRVQEPDFDPAEEPLAYEIVVSPGPVTPRGT
jgi:hypothetical protein